MMQDDATTQIVRFWGKRRERSIAGGGGISVFLELSMSYLHACERLFRVNATPVCAVYVHILVPDKPRLFRRAV